VLVIEDSLDTLNMMRLWLTTFGCEVWTASEANEGARVANGAAPGADYLGHWDASRRWIRTDAGAS
jgi:hypothetical protein